MTLTVVQPLYARGVDRTKAVKIAHAYIRKYQQSPQTCVHVWKKPYRASGEDHNVMLQQCKLCALVIGWVT